MGPPYAYSGLAYHGYAGYPYTHGLYYGKRSAEAEPEAAAKADPWLTYGAYGAYPYAYSGLYHGYAGYHPYAAHSYYYGKRSAEAKPEANADAYYGYYGYGARPYYGGYRGYYYG